MVNQLVRFIRNITATFQLKSLHATIADLEKKQSHKNFHLMVKLRLIQKKYVILTEI
ncbi:hypothetical protein IOK_11810 [Yersinia enterocolitica subsp. palearctica PhRBD_Ye1]|nr:hypothetical protein IOK_11810 [Yersinia enterocolitica subsp. palearctica PhRBD_Ye1]CNC21518.1 Uncharacterised protein [Yersinia enterocolitica]CQJ35458.1 Uncharacterised protein [Yersinia enterocolitica]VEA97465.1 Uncharacterised protein [Yersinia enterocolitica subsp. enterocolitica]